MTLSINETKKTSKTACKVGLMAVLCVVFVCLFACKTTLKAKIEFPASKSDVQASANIEYSYYFWQNKEFNIELPNGYKFHSTSKSDPLIKAMDTINTLTDMASKTTIK